MAGTFGRRQFLVAGTAAASASLLSSASSQAATGVTSHQAREAGTSAPAPRGNLINNSSFENAAPGQPVPGWSFF